VELQYSEVEKDIRVIQLTGRMDIIGTGESETEFSGYCAGDKVRIIVDVSGVDFLAASGIRLLTLAAKSVARREGKMVLLNPTPDVQSVLEITGIPAIIPVYLHLESAQTVLMAP
jgi:anti-anti-sigma factor